MKELMKGCVSMNKNYKDYYNKILSVIKNSTSDTSYLSVFNVSDDNKCNTRLIQKIGIENKELFSIDFIWSEEFQNDFIKPLIKSFASNNEIFSNEISNLSSNCLYQIHSTNNKGFVIRNINQDFALTLMNLASNVNYDKSEDFSINQFSKAGFASSLTMVSLLASILSLAVLVGMFLAN